MTERTTLLPRRVRADGERTADRNPEHRRDPHDPRAVPRGAELFGRGFDDYDDLEDLDDLDDYSVFDDYSEFDDEHGWSEATDLFGVERPGVRAGLGADDQGGSAQIHSFMAHLERRSVRLHRPPGAPGAPGAPDGSVWTKPGRQPDPVSAARLLHPAGRALAGTNAPRLDNAAPPADAFPPAISGEGPSSASSASSASSLSGLNGNAHHPGRAVSRGSASMAVAALAGAPVRRLAPVPEHALAPRPALVVLREPSTLLHARRRRAGLLLVYVILLGVAVLFTGAAMHTRLAARQVDLDDLRDREAVAERTHQQLRLSVAELESPGRIVSFAARLGMHVPSSVTYLEPLAEDVDGSEQPGTPARIAGSTALR